MRPRSATAHPIRAGAAGLALAAVALAGPTLAAQTAREAPELGAVRWLRDHDAALSRARGEGRPVFALFQEVPGCQTCVSFGQAVLSHPLLVDAIESEFVPLAILNNAAGADREVLERYGEPAWNNPVVRFLDARGRDLIPRQKNVYSAHAIASRMVASLEAAGRPVPRYLRVARAEARARAGRRATFATHCYWEGEACLGDLEGVIASRAAWMGGREVVQVTYDPQVLSFGALVTAARERGCSDRVFAHDPEQAAAARGVFGAAAVAPATALRAAGADDQKYYLRRSPLRALDLSELQSLRANAALARGEDPTPWLSPRQRGALVASGRR